MKKRLFIIGAGGFGRQLESYLSLVPKTKRDWDLTGYLDDNEDALVGKKTKYSVLGDISSYEFNKNDLALIGIADIEAKKKTVELLRERVEFLTFIAEDTLIGSNVSLGEGTIICPGAKLGSNLTVGDFVLINLNTIIGHDASLGDYCSIMTNVAVGGGVSVRNEVYMGTHVAVTPKITVAQRSHLGIGSVVIKDISEPGTYFGNPARKML